MIKVVIEGTIQIDDEIADVLKHLVSYDLHTWFVEHCSKEIKKEKLREVLDRIRTQLYPILEARSSAIEGIKEKLRKKL